MVQTLEDTEIFANIDHTLAEVLSIECDHVGLIPYDPSIHTFLKRPGIFLRDAPPGPTVEAIDRLGHRVVQPVGQATRRQCRSPRGVRAKSPAVLATKGTKSTKAKRKTFVLLCGWLRILVQHCQLPKRGTL
jgi:hypothetical protein